MRKLFFLKSQLSFSKEEMIKALSSINAIDISFIDDLSASFYLDDPTYSGLRQFLDDHHNLFSRAVILCGHGDGSFDKLFLTDASFYMPNMIGHVSDVLFRKMSFGDYSFLPILKNLFKDVEPEILKTAGQYLLSGLNAIEAAKALGVHRNTFSYRLEAFKDATGLDIRFYHDALLLELYFQIH